MPTMCPAAEWLDAGFVLSYSPVLMDMYRRASYFVDRILKGALPADLPVERTRGGYSWQSPAHGATLRQARVEAKTLTRRSPE
jgi:hypothetical protein